MARENPFDLTLAQRDAWLEQAEILQLVLAHHAGALYLEFSIPRMSRRIDGSPSSARSSSCWSSVGEDTFFSGR
jgi:hypothetical protein